MEEKWISRARGKAPNGAEIGSLMSLVVLARERQCNLFFVGHFLRRSSGANPATGEGLLRIYNLFHSISGTITVRAGRIAAERLAAGELHWIDFFPFRSIDSSAFSFPGT